MKKVILFIAESLDGYVATTDGSVAWLDKFNNDPNIDYEYNKFIENIDTVVQGNTTYKQFRDKHIGKNSYVFSDNAGVCSDEGVTFVKGSTRSFVDNLDNASHKNIWLVGGPNLLARFLNEGQVNEMIIFVMPVFLNDGIALFNNLRVAPVVSLLSTKKYANDVVELHYTISSYLF